MYMDRVMSMVALDMKKILELKQIAMKGARIGYVRLLIVHHVQSNGKRQKVLA
jgi:hypothetical protein